MTETAIPKTLEAHELDAAQAADVAGGNLCSADELVRITASLKEAYDNLVDFTSHVIERVAGS